MTLSYADLHWQDLHRLFGTIPAHVNNEELLRKWRNSCLQNNTHIVNEFFVKRVENFIQEFFSKDGLEASWYWYRFEWQKRGVVHAHLLARLKSDPGLTILSKEVYKGRMASRQLRAYQHVKTTSTITETDDWSKKNAPTDEYLLRWSDLLKYYQTSTNESYSEYDIKKLETIIKTGLDAENIIVKYRDYILSSINPNNTLPTDATKKEREPKIPFEGIHSSTICYEYYNYQYNVNHDNYKLLINQNYRHRCTADYCLRKGSCRFKFPRDLASTSRICVQELSYKAGPKKDTFRRSVMTFVPKTNDRWINSHCPIGTTSWGGMLDVQILLDDDTIRQYVTKYGTKLEGESKSLSNILRLAVQRGKENDQSTKTMYRSAFIKAIGGREKCKQEVCHLSLSTPVVKCSEEFLDIRLNGMTRLVDTNTTDNDKTVTIFNALDIYAFRLDKMKWSENIPWTDIFVKELLNMTLIQFVSKYKTGRQGINRNKIIRMDKPKIPLCTPTYSSLSESTNYHMYCYYALLKYKPWKDYPQSVYTKMDLKLMTFPLCKTMKIGDY